ncbi:MAG: hypothetical protein Q9O24_12610 [Gammaproteobacteria bacterium]|nr:hypothetical protein [Gammaproteobacteria bacterium]
MEKKRESPQASGASVAQRGAGMTVEASPFNGVKLELGIILALLLMLWLVHDFWLHESVSQLLLLFVGGLLGMGWLIWRTQKVIKRMELSGRGKEK